MTALEVRPLAAADEARFDAFVRAHERGTFFHLTGWRRAVARVFRHSMLDHLAWRGDAVAGVLPLMMSPRLLGGENLLSSPYAVYGGPLGADSVAEQELVSAAVRLADNRGVGYLELRYQHDPGPDLVGTDLYWTFIRDLPADPAEVLARMPKKARADARRGRERHGLELSHGVWYLDDLYRLFLQNKHALGSPALPQAFFAELTRVFGPAVQVHLVRRGREPLAAVMTFSFRDTLIAYYSGTASHADREYKASNFMYMALQEWAVEQGFRRFDFGRSRADAGAFSFKKHQGFEPEQLHYRYHLVRARRVPSFTPSNPRTATLRKAWQRLPHWAVARLSNGLARYLP
jgi:FemAB-related protein (PEP-CTERM system-associated)